MRLPVRLTRQHPLRKISAAISIAIVACILAALAHHLPGVSIAMEGLDNTLYDAFYRYRKPERRVGDQIVIVTVDEQSLEALAKKNYQWPWPRIFWASMTQYMEQAGARAVVFDIIFKEPRAFDHEFGKAIDAAKIPVVLANAVDPDGKFESFAPAVKKLPRFGAINNIEDEVVRRYVPVFRGQPSLALRAVQAIGATTPPWATQPFRLHYYGPNVLPDGGLTYNYLPAFRVAKAALVPAEAKLVNISPEMFKGKIVIVGSTARAVFDVKSSPLSKIYPGVEVQATAIDNLLNGQRVWRVGSIGAIALTFLGTVLAAIGVILPRKVVLKVLLAAIATGVLIGISVLLFVGHAIHWLPMASPAVALITSVVLAFAWSYLTEDRDRRLVFKALSQYVSPEVAHEIQRMGDPKLGGERREMTVMFTDIQGFTDLSESMDSEKLSQMLNFYLGEMSGVILTHNGTLDKYIGDAIMSFWNAPIPQADHAALACRAAIGIRDREAQIQNELASFGAKGMLTRIGVNTGPMVFGNMGAPQKFNYSVLGDSVNLGSRLEGANKFYGSRILIAESTAQLVKDRFVLRKLDLLRVKGKQQPVPVYELIAEGQPDADAKERITKYEQALTAYRSQKWDEAEEILNSLHKQYPDDLPTGALLKRIAKLRLDPPGENWDGVYVAKDK